MSAEPEGHATSLLVKAAVVVVGLLFAFTLLLSVLSFPAGIYAILFTQLSPGLGAGTLVIQSLLIGPLPVRIPTPLPVWGLFAAMMTIYAIFFVVAAASGPNPLAAFSAGFRRGLSSLMSNGLVVAVVSIGFLAFTATYVDTAVAAGGVPIGGPSGPALAIFLSVTTAPFVEEFGFRFLIVGLVALVLSLGMHWKSALKSLWRPAACYETDEIGSQKAAVVWAVVVLGAVAFGFAHIASGSGWELGKLPEATYGGLVLGYLYVKYGFHVAVLTHWGIDYLGSAFAFYGQGAYGIPWNADPGYIMQQVVTYNFLDGIGIVSFFLVVYLGVTRVIRGRAEATAL